MKIQHIHGLPPLYTNTFLITTDAGHGILIDAAAAPETYLDALKAENATLTHILLTHGHYDHVGAVAALKQATGCTVYMDPVDAAGTQLLPLKPGQVDKNWPANNELNIDGLTFKIYHTPGHTQGSVVLNCGNLLFSVIRCLPAPAGVPICPAAACAKCRKACPCWPTCLWATTPRFCRGTRASPPSGRSAAPTPTWTAAGPTKPSQAKEN